MIRVTCPVCGQLMQGASLTEWPQFPFCGPRCKTIDLGRWLDEQYRIPAEEDAEGGPSSEADTP